MKERKINETIMRYWIIGICRNTKFSLFQIENVRKKSDELMIGFTQKRVFIDQSLDDAPKFRSFLELDLRFFWPFKSNFKRRISKFQNKKFYRYVKKGIIESAFNWFVFNFLLKKNWKKFISVWNSKISSWKKKNSFKNLF